MRFLLLLHVCSPALAVDPAWLKDKLSRLSGAQPVDIAGELVTISERHSDEKKRWARELIAAELRSFGYQVTMKPYAGGVNVVAEKKGAGDTFYLLGAHYDTVRRSPGADDDGAGVVSMLAIASDLAKVPLKHGVRFVAFDQEEQGMVGSTAYVRAMRTADELDDLKAAVVLEMTAYDSDDDGKFHAIDCGKPGSPEIAADVERVAKGQGLTRVEACTSRSDHIAFWNAKKPAIAVSENFFGGDGNPCYHRACDTVNYLNFGYMARITTAVGEAMKQWLSH